MQWHESIFFRKQMSQQSGTSNKNLCTWVFYSKINTKSLHYFTTRKFANDISNSFSKKATCLKPVSAVVSSPRSSTSICTFWFDLEILLLLVRSLDWLRWASTEVSKSWSRWSSRQSHSLWRKGEVVTSEEL